jgi:hypothetical protein
LIGGIAANVCRGQIPDPFYELPDVTDDPAGVRFAAFEYGHPAGGHPDFPEQRFDGFGALVRTAIALEMTAPVLFTGHDDDPVRAGLECLDQIWNIHLSRTGQTDGLDDVSCPPIAKTGKLVCIQIV